MSEVITTVKQALEETVKMWKWIVKNTTDEVFVDKEGYILQFPNGIIDDWDCNGWINDCACCEFVGWNDEDHLRCNKCPISIKAWGGTSPDHVNVDKYGCEGHASPYCKWHEAAEPRDKKIYAEAVLLLAEIALKELLEKDGTND